MRRILNTYTEYLPPEDVLTPAEIRDICCKDVPVDVCSEVGKVSVFDGAGRDEWDFDPDAALEQARLENPDKRIISVRTEGLGPPPGEPCGKKHEEWTGRLNCCDFVEPLGWNSELSVEVLVPGSSGLVFVTGGRPPYIWKLRGQGMTFDGYALREAITDAPSIRVYAGPYACGWSPIEVTDGCSVANGGIRATVGAWYSLGYHVDARDFPAWGSVVAPVAHECQTDISSITRVRHDQDNGRYALVYGTSVARPPDPSVDRIVQYSQRSGFPGGTCVCTGSFGDVLSKDAHLGIFDVWISANTLGPFANNPNCPGTNLYTAYWISNAVLVEEWRC